MISSFSFNSNNLKVGDFGSNRQQLTTSVASAVPDPFKIFTENFDLSLLPEENTDVNYVNDQQNIPTTVYQYNEPDFSATNQKQFQQIQPEIKIEQSWPQVQSTQTDNNPENFQIATKETSLLYEQLSRHQDQVNGNKNYLIPPPPYPNIYPSPQSSPSQSDYSFSFAYQNRNYESLSSSRSSLYSSSPCPSLESSNIKQELHILPPSPPDSNCEAHSPISSCSEIKSEPFEIEPEIPAIDLKALLEFNKNQSLAFCSKQEDKEVEESLKSQLNKKEASKLRECLEDQHIQSQLNSKTFATLETFIEGLEAESEDFEPVLSLAFEHVKKDAEALCKELQISPDPTAWSPIQVHAWLRSTIEQFKLPPIENLESKFSEDGATLLLLTEEEFIQKVPQGGSTLHAQLEIWKMIYSDEYQKNLMPSTSFSSSSNSNNSNNSSTSSFHHLVPKTDWNPEVLPNLNMDIDDESEGEEDLEGNIHSNEIVSNGSGSVGNKRSGLPGRNGGSHIHLWQFLKELLQAPHVNGTAIRWIDRSKGIFKIEDSVRVAKLWGKRKNRPAMNYDKLSRSIRQYYKKGIMKKTERSQRLVYQFCHPYYL